MASTVSSGGAGTPVPQLKVSKYDSVSSFLLATGGILTLVVGILILVWLTNIQPTRTDDTIPIEMVGGGYEDGAIDETLNVESPEDPTDDPSVAEEPSEETELMEMLENVVEMSDASTQLVTEVLVSGAENKGTPGSHVGTGRRPLGSGGGDGGYPREQRWFVKFDDRGSLKTYAKQLDFFGIELGAFFPSEKKLVYLSQMSRDKPGVREIRTGKDDRVYMNWKGGDRRKADIALFAKAGVDARGAAIVHFYPTKTEQLLVRTEREYQNMPSSKIRRTYFTVRAEGGGYAFKVTKQNLR